MNVAFKQKLESIFRSVVFIIFCITAWFAIPGTFWPHAVLDVLHIPVLRDLVWAAFAFQLAFLVSLYSLPVILDWRRYLFNALLSGYVHIALALYWWLMYPWQTGFSAVGMGFGELVMGVAILGLLSLIWTSAIPQATSSAGETA